MICSKANKNSHKPTIMKTTLKATLLVFCLMVLYQSAQSQTGSGFGIKGGLNYNSNGKYFKDAELVLSDPLNNWGYNLGLFGKFEVGPLFIRPELVYTQLNSEINSVQFRTERLDVPVLVGLNILGPVVSVFAGPDRRTRESSPPVRHALGSVGGTAEVVCWNIL